MRVEQWGGGEERLILTGMITNTQVVAMLAGRWDRTTGMFASKWANLIGMWCIKFYERYGAAPNASLRGIYESWVSKEDRDKDTVQMVERFLGSLNDEYELLAKDQQPDYVIDVAGQHFNRVAARRLKDQIEGDIDNGDVEQAFKRINDFRKVELGGGAGVDFFSDEAAFVSAFETLGDPLIKYPGDLGKFINKMFLKGRFVGLTGSAKTGKSFWLQDFGLRGILGGHKVAHFEVGDMTQADLNLRWGSRLARHPILATEPGEPIQIPKGIIRNPDDAFAEITEYELAVYETGLTPEQGWAAIERFRNDKLRDTADLFRYTVHPNRSINVDGMCSILRGWERHGWVPDIIICDYADILLPPRGIQENRDQINETWMQLRRLSQGPSLPLVITGTQADADSYRTDTIGRGNFSGDRRKNDHVTGMIGLNQTNREKELGIIRLNTFDGRAHAFSERRCVHVAQCLGLSNPAVFSTF